jgi:hypothetical protein
VNGISGPRIFRELSVAEANTSRLSPDFRPRELSVAEANTSRLDCTLVLRHGNWGQVTIR